MDSPKTDSRSRSTIALAAVGNLGKYLCEELLHDSRFDVVVLSRKVRVVDAESAVGQSPQSTPQTRAGATGSPQMAVNDRGAGE